MTPEQANDPNAPQAGVLAALPRTRPQRTSARREAARARAQSETASTASVRKQDASEQKAKPKERASTKPKPTPKAKPAAKPRTTTAKKTAKRPSTKVKRPVTVKQEERAPKQGYEPEEEIELGNTVHPPSGGELIESIADIFGELAGLGANAGGRLLKDALSIFRRP
jgi:hypothetical protein